MSDDLFNDKDIAALVGLQLQEPAADPDFAAALPTVEGHGSSPLTQDAVPNEPALTSPDASDPPDTPEALLDPEDLAELVVRAKRSQSLAANPFAKLGVVAAGTGLVVLILAVLTMQVMNSEGAKHPEKTAKAAAPSIEQSKEKDDRGELLTDLALGRQQQALEALAAESETPPVPAPSPPETSTPVHQPLPAPPPPVIIPSSQPSPSPAPAVQEEPVDPMEHWIALAQLGSYGTGIASSSEDETVDEAADLQGVSEPEMAEQLAADAAPVRLASLSDQSRLQREEAAILSGRPIRSTTVATGTTAQAVLQSSLIWSESIQSEPLQLVVQLTEPLLASQGEVWLPAGTVLVVQVRSLDDSGLAYLSATAVVQDDGQEYPLPQGAIALRAANGKPLMARKFGGGSTTRADLTNALLSGISRAAELLNQPESSSSVTAFGSTSVTQTNRDTDVLAGVLEGTFSDLRTQIAERQQTALQSLNARPTIWYLKSGTQVEIFVNRAVEVDR